MEAYYFLDKEGCHAVGVKECLRPMKCGYFVRQFTITNTESTP